MTSEIREGLIAEAIFDSLASEDWSDQLLVRQRAEAKLGYKLKPREFSRAVVALIRQSRIEQRRNRRGGESSPHHMQYKRAKARNS